MRRRSTVLTYLGDTRLVIHLAARLSENGLLAYYYVGTQVAH